MLHIVKYQPVNSWAIIFDLYRESILEYPASLHICGFQKVNQGFQLTPLFRLLFDYSFQLTPMNDINAS